MGGAVCAVTNVGTSELARDGVPESGIVCTGVDATMIVWLIRYRGANQQSAHLVLRESLRFL